MNEKLSLMLVFGHLNLTTALPALMVRFTANEAGNPSGLMSVQDEGSRGGGGGASLSPDAQAALTLLVEGAPKIPAELRPLTREDVAVIHADAQRRINNAFSMQDSLPAGAIIDEDYLTRAAIQDWIKHADKRRAHLRYQKLMQSLNNEPLDWHDFVRGAVDFKQKPYHRFLEVEQRRLIVGSVAKLSVKRKGRFMIVNITPQCWIEITDSKGVKSDLMSPTEFKGGRKRKKKPSSRG